MRIAFIAGFGPVGANTEATLGFWADVIGVPFEEIAPGYHHAPSIEGARAFALWPLSQAAQATFGTERWPEGLPTPQAWIEIEVDSPQAVAEATEELHDKGQKMLIGAHEEPWGQTTARLLSPEGILVGISYFDSLHVARREAPSPRVDGLSVAAKTEAGARPALTVDDLLELERRGWDALCRADGGSFYGRIMTPDAVMVLVNGMILDVQAVVESLNASPPWASYSIDDVRLVPTGDASAALLYRATAVRAGQDEPFVALMTSHYRLVDGEPALTLYQQTPISF